MYMCNLNQSDTWVQHGGCQEVGVGEIRAIKRCKVQRGRKGQLFKMNMFWISNVQWGDYSKWYYIGYLKIIKHAHLKCSHNADTITSR